MFASAHVFFDSNIIISLRAVSTATRFRCRLRRLDY